MKVRDFEFGFLSKAEVPRAKPKFPEQRRRELRYTKYSKRLLYHIKTSLDKGSKLLAF